MKFIKTDTGYAIVREEPGPYSHSAPNVITILEMTTEDMLSLAASTHDLPEPKAADPKGGV